MIWLLVIAVLLGLVFIFLRKGAGGEAEATASPPGRLVDVGGYRLHAVVQGEGSPTVIFLNGLGETAADWGRFAQGVAAFTRVVAYDRPGVGGSESGPRLEATGAVDDLHYLLGGLEIPGPYLLVGHSVGGVLAQLYALRYPDYVAGLVLIDSFHENHRREWDLEVGLGLTEPLLRGVEAMAAKLGEDQLRTLTRGDAMKALEARALMQLLQETEAVFAEAPKRHPFGDLPLGVLSTRPAREDLRLLRLHKRLADRSINSFHWIARPKGSKLIHVHPKLVLDAIQEVIERARKAQRL